jgi:hypothetical protein
MQDLKAIRRFGFVSQTTPLLYPDQTCNILQYQVLYFSLTHKVISGIHVDIKSSFPFSGKQPIKRFEVTIQVSPGKRIYTTGTATVKAEGRSYSQKELTEALEGRIAGLLWDDAGRSRIKETLREVADTAFSTKMLERVLIQKPSVKDWQVGEAIAEAYLEDHRQCRFPWPAGRDIRNPNASPAGADLVGFREQNDETIFAFGEVKTSGERKYPPQVVTGSHGLESQLKKLRDSVKEKDHLAILYLGHRSPGTVWEKPYRAAAALYLKNPNHVSLIGILIRDVEPDKNDLENPAIRLGNNYPGATSIELYAIYLPIGAIPTLSKRAGRSGI